MQFCPCVLLPRLTTCCADAHHTQFRTCYHVPPAWTLQHIQHLADRVQLSTLPLHLHEIAGAFLLYDGIYLVVSPLLSAKFAPRTYSHLPRGSQIDWDIRVVSQSQSILISGLALYVIFADPAQHGLNSSGRIWRYSGAVGMVQGLAAGYLLWDVRVSATNMAVLGPSSLAHAISALVVTIIAWVL